MFLFISQTLGNHDVDYIIGFNSSFSVTSAIQCYHINQCYNIICDLLRLIYDDVAFVAVNVISHRGNICNNAAYLSNKVKMVVFDSSLKNIYFCDIFDDCIRQGCYLTSKSPGYFGIVGRCE